MINRSRRTWLPLGLSLACAIGAPIAGHSQTRIQAPNGALSGEVHDSLTGRPIGYALVTWLEKSIRLFANETGRFRVDGLRPGRLTLRLQQIGYGQVDVALVVVNDSLAPATLHLAAVRQEYQLPELQVVGDRSRCLPGLAAAPGSAAIMDRVRANVDRVRTLEHDYPFEIRFDHTSAIVDSAGSSRGLRRRTFVYSSKELVGYRAGRVADAAGRITLFTVSDVAREEFQRRHCFWYDGVDTVGGEIQHRITFTPAPKTRSIDWTGTLSIDAETAVLKRSAVQLTNLTEKSSIIATSCVIDYAEIVPTLVLEQNARCWTEDRNRSHETVYDERRLVSHRFLKRRPGDP